MRNSFAFGKVVLITSCSKSELDILRNIAKRWDEVLLSLRKPFP